MRCMHQDLSLPCKKAVTDPLENIKKYSYKIALPAPTLYGQFGPGYSRERIVLALKQYGFDYVFEVARAAEIVTNATEQYMLNKDIKNLLYPLLARLLSDLFRYVFPI